MAGAGGFEPPYRGIKIRCLTTWLRPKRLGRLTARRPSRQQDRRRNPRHVGVKIEAYPGREDGIVRISSGQVTGAGRAASVASASGRERGQPARWRSGCHFPVISRLRTIFPDFGTRKFPVWAAAMRGCGYPKQLIQQCYSQGGQAIFAPERVFLREFSRFNRELGEPVQRRPLP